MRFPRVNRKFTFSRQDQDITNPGVWKNALRSAGLRSMLNVAHVLEEVP